MTLKEVFVDCRVVGICGNRNTGKTNNIFFLLNQLRKEKKHKHTKIYAFGLPPSTHAYCKKLNIKLIDGLNQLQGIKDAIIILDEFQLLGLNDRRNKELLQSFMGFVYHNNNYVLFCSPTTREYNSIIGGYIEKWLLKAMSISDVVNGSQLKQALINYKGHYKQLDYFNVPVDEFVVLNNIEQHIIKCDYVKVIDTKHKLKALF
jgi:hypothetical protein